MLAENRITKYEFKSGVPLKPMLGGVRIVAHSITSYEQTL